MDIIKLFLLLSNAWDASKYAGRQEKRTSSSFACRLLSLGDINVDVMWTGCHHFYFVDALSINTLLERSGYLECVLLIGGTIRLFGMCPVDWWNDPAIWNVSC